LTENKGTKEGVTTGAQQEVKPAEGVLERGRGMTLMSDLNSAEEGGDGMTTVPNGGWQIEQEGGAGVEGKVNEGQKGGIPCPLHKRRLVGEHTRGVTKGPSNAVEQLGQRNYAAKKSV